MTLSFENPRAVVWNKSVDELFSEIEKHITLLPYIGIVLATHSKNESGYLTEIDKKIDAYFSLGRLRDFSITTCKLMKSIYRDPNFGKIRSEILERVVYEYGPFSEKINRKSTYIEPTLKDERGIIGISNHKCDVVFHETDLTPMELIECRSNISNTIPSDRPFSEAYERNKKKVLYLYEVHDHLSVHYIQPEMYFGTYSLNYTMCLQRIMDYGYNCFKMINLQDITTSVQQRQQAV